MKLRDCVLIGLLGITLGSIARAPFIENYFDKQLERGYSHEWSGEALKRFNLISQESDRLERTLFDRESTQPILVRTTSPILPRRAQPNNQETEEQTPEPKNPNLPYAQYTANWEGREPRVYDPNPKDNRDEPTIGVGFYMDRADGIAIFNRILPDINFQEVRRGNIELTQKQIDELFANDINIYIGRTRARIQGFDNLPEYVRTALVDGTFRGDLGPKTRALINEGNWQDAAKEYLDHSQYKNAEALGIPGIRPRMESNQRAMSKYAEELGGK